MATWYSYCSCPILFMYMHHAQWIIQQHWVKCRNIHIYFLGTVGKYTLRNTTDYIIILSWIMLHWILYLRMITFDINLFPNTISNINNIIDQHIADICYIYLQRTFVVVSQSLRDDITRPLCSQIFLLLVITIFIFLSTTHCGLLIWTGPNNVISPLSLFC
jgi:hypothetical protein